LNDEAKTKKPKDPEKRKKRLKKIFYTLAAILILLILALIYYLLTQSPITRILPIGPKNPPRYVRSIYGDFKHLTGIAVNKNGSRFYVVDATQQKIWAFNRNGSPAGSFGEPQSPAEKKGFRQPLFVALDPQNNIYVTDRAGFRIGIFSPLGKFSGYFIPTPGQEFIWSPLAIDFDNNGLMYLTDAKTGEHRVLVFNKKGKLVRQFGTYGRGRGQFAYPNGISVDSDGNIYVADTNSARIQVFNNKGKFLTLFKPGTGTNIEITHPVGIDATRPDEILVVESFGHEVQAYDSEGNFLYKFGSFGLGDGQFRYPQGIAVANDGRVYIADRGNNRIQIWQY